MDFKLLPAQPDEGPFVRKNESLSGEGNLVFDYVIENLAKQPQVAEAYRQFSDAAKNLIDDEQLATFLKHSR